MFLLLCVAPIFLGVLHWNESAFFNCLIVCAITLAVWAGAASIAAILYALSGSAALYMSEGNIIYLERWVFSMRMDKLREVTCATRPMHWWSTREIVLQSTTGRAFRFDENLFAEDGATIAGRIEELAKRNCAFQV